MRDRMNRFQKLEETMTRVLGVTSGIFLVYLITAGCGIGWLKGICAVLTILTGTGCFGHLYLSGEWLKRRSLWLSAWAVALVLCTVFSLILQFPAPHPAK